MLELKELISKYPKDLSAIRNYLKIPKSSFQRLFKEWTELDSGKTGTNQKEWTELDSGKTSTNQKDSANDYLDKVEQAFISKLIKPPTNAISIPKI